MNRSTFDVNKLNKSDRAVYDAMTDYEKQRFESAFTQLELQKKRLLQYKNLSKERNARERREQTIRDRKARTKRLIERGAILEKYLEYTDFTNDEVSFICKRLLASDYSRKLINKMIERHEHPSQGQDVETQ